MYIPVHLVLPAGHGCGHDKIAKLLQLLRGLDLERQARSPLGHAIALGYLKDGTTRMGERLRAVNLLAATETEIEIVSPHFIDPEGSRLRA